MFWHNLAEDFKNLDPAQALSIAWQITSGNPGHHRYKLDGGSELLRLSFQRLVLTAVDALGEPRGQNAFDVWYEKLRMSDRDSKNTIASIGPEVLQDGQRVFHHLGRIRNAAEASACLCMVFEMQTTESARLMDAETAVRTLPGPAEADPLQSSVSNGATGPADTGPERKRPGPKPDTETARRILAIVTRVADAKGWKGKLDDVCDALDDEEIPRPKTWPKRDLPIRSWTDAATTERELAKKAIGYYLKVARG